VSDSPSLGSAVTGIPVSSSPSIAGHRFASGTSIAGRYRIVALLGRGGMGEVYRADDLVLGQSVALKFLPVDTARDQQWLERFRGEVRAARLVSHPNVCRVHDIGEFDGQPFLSMEYVDGEDLASLLRRIGRLPPDKALDVARQLCAGLAAAHQQGVIHRDLKPANVMLDARGQVRITDFGLAGIPDPKTSDIAGTPAYMAPELFAGGTASVRSDLYALGLVLYEVFSGRQAIVAATLAELRLRHSETTPASLRGLISDIDPSVDRIVQQCLAKDPAERPASALAVSAALPGGDPIAAALARGETPSPSAVAAAGNSVSISPALALACLVGLLTSLAVIVLLAADIQVTRLVPLDKPPVVLTQDARDILTRLGHQTTDHTATGFGTTRYLALIRERDQSPNRWERLRSLEPPGMTFWYRQSPSLLTRESFFLAGEVTLAEPPLTTPGTIAVVVDPRGRLRFLSAALLPTEVSASRPPFDWNRAFAEAGLDPAAFTSQPSTFVPPVYAEGRRAWNGSYPSQPDVPLRIEAAEFAGRLVYFEVFDADVEVPLVERQRRADRGLMGMNVVRLPVLMIIALALGAVLLARRHASNGRGDVAGAKRLGAVLGALSIAAGALRSTEASFDVLSAVVARGLLLAATVAIAYVALEPFLRRHWPTTMISWSRLLSGRWRDPLVARDLLVGLCAGAMIAVLGTFFSLAPRLFGSPPDLLSPGPIVQSLRGVRFSAATLLSGAGAFVLMSLWMVLLFFVLSQVLRRRWLAMAVFLLAVAGFMSATQDALTVAYALLVAVVILGVLLRFGLLALLVSPLTTGIGMTTLTLDTSSWYAPASWMVLLIYAGLAMYAYRLALAGRPAFGRSLLDD
jgi:tRNA A-37 threonylcarbamoyl transferase component Bud32